MYQKTGYIILIDYIRGVGDIMSDRIIRKLQRKIRKLDYPDRMYLRDWMNQWYEAMKEEQEMQREEEE